VAVTVVPETIEPVSVVVDIANVMGARADGWWKDRAKAAARLCREVGELSGKGLAASELPADVALAGDRIDPQWVLVLEGAARGAADDQSASLGPRVRLVLAPGSGDDAIAREAADLTGCRLVVTADRELRRRCEQAGAVVAGPRWLLGLLGTA
jgi:hypothetical protein